MKEDKSEDNKKLKNRSEGRKINNSVTLIYSPFSSQEKNKFKIKINSKKKKYTVISENGKAKNAKKIGKTIKKRKYLKRICKNQLQINLDVDNNSITIKEFLCGICEKTIVKSCVAICGHNFCSFCLHEEWLIQCKDCPVCKMDIRGGKIIQNFNLDEIIKLEVEKIKGEVLKDYSIRLNEFICFTKLKKRGLEKLRVGDLVDVRDTEMVWCVAQVKKIIKDEVNKETISVSIHFLGWSDFYDEEVVRDSPRIAILGFYTMRNNIPMYIFDRYQLNKGNCFAANLLIPRDDQSGFKKLKNYAVPKLRTCEEYYFYENSKICD